MMLKYIKKVSYLYLFASITYVILETIYISYNILIID
jgi:hypothetical protein